MSAVPEPDTGSAVEENVETIKKWDQALLEKRSYAQRISDRITLVAASGPSMVVHATGFATWILVNTEVLPIIAPFDPFPFDALTMMMSLEAIFLAMFVLASQNRLANQSELRANLTLQIDLLAEREMTAVLQLLKDISAHLNVRTGVRKDELDELIEKTDVQELASQVDSEKPAQH